MSAEPLAKIGLFCTSAADDDLDFALRSIELNTSYPDFAFLAAVDHDTPNMGKIEEHARRYPFFRYVTIPPRRLNSARDTLESLVQTLIDDGCTRFFHINDDIAVGRHWLHYAESALRRLDGVGVVIPHDGIVSVSTDAGFCGFYYFSLEYVRRFHPGGVAYGNKPIQCYWVDTEFCVRAAHHGRLVREPRCIAQHVHWSALPETLGVEKRRRASVATSLEDGRHFVQRMRAEGIDPWEHIPNLADVTPVGLMDEMRALRRPVPALAE